MIRVAVNEQDFDVTFGEKLVDVTLRGKGEAVLGKGDTVSTISESAEEAFFEMLPKVIAGKLSRMIPEKFKVHEIELEMEISGNPFGIGVSGKALLRFGPK